MTKPTDRALRAATIAFAVAFVLHNADHFRRGTDATTPQVLWGGTVLGVLALGAIALAAIGHRRAPHAAVVAGLLLAVGAAASHLLPTWSVFSDSLLDTSQDAFTWFAVLAEVAAALVFAAVGWRVLARDSAVRPVSRRVRPGDQR